MSAERDLLLEAVNAATHAGRDAAIEAGLVPRPGVVVSVDPTNTTALVRPDGPEGPLGDTHGASIAAPVTLRPGDRVLLMYAGSSPGCFVLGRRSGDCEDWHIVGNDAEPQFLTGWGHTAGTVPPGQNGNAQVMYTMRSGRVELRGRAHRSSGVGAGIFDLAEPYWPDNDLLLSAQGVLGAHISINIEFSSGRVSVADAGEADVVFDGISYLARIQQVGN